MTVRKSKLVLFVDDNPDMLEIGGIILRKAGYDYLSVHTGEKGLETLLENTPDLVILDYMMPHMTGFEFYSQLMTNAKYGKVRHTPVIMLTAISEADVEREQLFEMGLSAFLLKPFGNRELLNVIDNVFILHDMRVKNKQLEEQVKRTEYKYQDLIENASDLIFTLDTSAKFVFVNRLMSSITGHDREEWMNRSFYDLIYEEDRENAKAKFASTIQGKSNIFEGRLRHSNGQFRYLSININPIFEKGQVIGSIGIARDITEKRRLEQEVIELKNFNESIIQSMGSGLITIDLKHRITSFNNSAEDLLGYSAGETVGRSLEGLFSPEDCQTLLSNIGDPDQHLLNREMEFSAKNGKPIYIGFTVAPRYDIENRRVGTIISFKDITQIKQMAVEVQRMDRLASMGVLASGIAHEIRNPLAGIKTIAQTLEEEIEPDDSRREYISRIVRQVNRMDDLLKTIFSYAKPRQPKRKYYPLQEIIQEVVALLENRMREQLVKCSELYHPDLSLLYVDFYQIQQVFVNLFLNALDAMPDGGELRLEAVPSVTTLQRVDRRGRSFPIQNKSALYIEVLLYDDGEGIAEDAIDSVFNPFFTTKPQGSGLGLSIVYRIVTEHDGEIQVESQPGEGTVFKLLLPTEE